MSSTPAAPKSIAQKLGITPADILRLVGADDEMAALLDPLPPDIVISGSQPADAAVIFVTGAADLRERLATELTALPGARCVWIAYRKGNVIDMNRNTIMVEAQSAGWDTVANVAMGDVWSAVRIKPLG